MKISILRLLLGLTLVLPSQADTLLSNFPGPFSSDSSTVGLNFLDFQVAVGFTVPGGTNYTITDVQMPLLLMVGHQGQNGEAVLELRNDAPGTPGGSVLQSFLTPPPLNPSDNFQTYTFLPQGGFQLQGGESYWLVLRRLAGSATYVEWQRSLNDVMPTGLASGISYQCSSSAGATWQPCVIQGLFGPDVVVADAINVSVQSTGAPEPGTALGLSGGLVLLLIVRASQSRRTRL